MKTCTATRRDGQPCTARAHEDGRCFAHSPALQGKRAAASAAGGRNKATGRRLEKMMPVTLRPVLTTLYETLAGLQAGVIEPRTATAIATVAGALVRVFEVSELEASLQETQRKTG